MNRICPFAVLIGLLIFVFTSCSFRSTPENKSKAPDAMPGYGSLGKFPFREAWYGMYFQDTKVGYSHFKIEPEGANFRIASDSFMRLTTDKKTDEIDMKERIVVQPDLSMISFESSVNMNDKKMSMKGTVEGNEFLVKITVGDQSLDRRYPIEGKIFHSSAISLMPALRGTKEGESYSFVVFNAEKQRLDNVEQSIFPVLGTPGPKGAVWKIKNKFGASVVYSWLDTKGLTVIEKAMAGSLVTLMEDASTAKEFLERKRVPRSNISGVRGFSKDCCEACEVCEVLKSMISELIMAPLARAISV